MVMVNAAWVMVTPTLPVLVITPVERAVAEFTSGAAVAMAVNETVILVLWPGAKLPRPVQVNVPALVLVGARLADWKLSLADGKLSVSRIFVSVVLPLFTTCKL